MMQSYRYYDGDLVVGEGKTRVIAHPHGAMFILPLAESVLREHYLPHVPLRCDVYYTVNREAYTERYHITRLTVRYTRKGVKMAKASYWVDAEQGTCTCMAYQVRKDCKHLALVRTLEPDWDLEEEV